MITRTFIAVFKIPRKEVKENRREAREYRNPMFVARSLKKKLDKKEFASRAELARSLGMSRARITQLLQLLDLAPTVIEEILDLGDPMPERYVTERELRRIVSLPFTAQVKKVRAMLKG